MSHSYAGAYTERNLERIAFPLGGLGAGMICLEGTGSLSNVSILNRPQLDFEPLMFAAVGIAGHPGLARLIEGPVQEWKVFFSRGPEWESAGNGAPKKAYGLPRFRDCSFGARFPFATVKLSDKDLPVTAELTGWSPFTPPAPDDSSLPAAALEYRITNTSDIPLNAVFSFHAENFLKNGKQPAGFELFGNGFMLHGGDSTGGASPAENGKRTENGGPAGDGRNTAYFTVTCDSPTAAAHAIRAGNEWFDAKTAIWNTICRAEVPPADGSETAAGEETAGAPARAAEAFGGGLYVPLSLPPGSAETVRLLVSWYAGDSALCEGFEPDGSRDCSRTYTPWYAGRFSGPGEVASYWAENAERLREESLRFTEAFFSTDMPAEALEAASANLSILKSPTVLRQTDGRLWAWEGCHDEKGCCHGSCTHVWNYAQAIPHLFPSLERTLRETEFGENQAGSGHQHFRANLPIRPTDHGFHAAADGQLGGIMKVYREWRISGSDEWLARLWPSVRRSLEFCIAQWDPAHEGLISETHHNTYDIEFYGPEGMCSSIYLGALKAASVMAVQLEDPAAETFKALYEKGRKNAEEKLFNGEFFIQLTEEDGEKSGNTQKYQIGSGCLSDGVIGAWLSAVCGTGEILDPAKVEKHLRSVYRWNFRRDLSAHGNPQRGTYALGGEGGLLLCTWPQGGKPELPFVYSDEVWTGIEYQVASHLIMTGHRKEGLELVRAVRDRYDGRKRNPFDEYECGHFYARALASYALIQACSGISWDGRTGRLSIRPPEAGDFRSFICTETGYGVAGVRDGEPFLEVRSGAIEVNSIEYIPATSASPRALPRSTRSSAAGRTR